MEPYNPVAYDAVLNEMLEEAGVKRLHGHRISAVEDRGDDLVVSLDDGRSIVASGLVDATGDA